MNNHVQPQPAWDIFDSSKIQDYLRCPRFYFYRHMLGWRHASPNNHLEYGQGMHLALEFLYANGFTDTNIVEAYEIFLNHYRQHFGEHEDELFFPKTPRRMLEAIAKYVVNYSRDLKDYKVLYTEVAGSVPIAQDRLIHFRIDAIMEDSDGNVFVLEHKTGSGHYLWDSQWLLSIQTGTYTHALYCIYPQERVKGVLVNGIHFLKRKTGDYIDFRRVPCWKTPDHMRVWHWNVLTHTDNIVHNMEALAEATDNDPTMACFPLNPTSCNMWNRLCEYHSYCCAWPNPLRRCQEPPLDMIVEFWNPNDKPATTRMDLR